MPTILPVTVLDSSVLVPAWSRIVLQRLASEPDQRYVPVWSEWIVAETWRVFAWRWLTRAPALVDSEWNSLTRSANEMLRHLLSVMTLVTLRGYAGPGPWPDLRDLDDEPVWQTAIVANAVYVVSDNVTHFPPLDGGRHRHGGIEYLTAIEFIEDVLGENSTEIYEGPVPSGAFVRSNRVP